MTIFIFYVNFVDFNLTSHSLKNPSNFTDSLSVQTKLRWRRKFLNVVHYSAFKRYNLFIIFLFVLMFRNFTLSPILSMSDKWSFYSCVLDQARCFVKRNTYIIASSRVFQSTWSEKVPSHYHCWRKFTRTGNIAITFPRFSSFCKQFSFMAICYQL